jgi:hypothetical protein
VRLQKRVISYEDFDVSANELLTIREAAEKLGVKINAVLGLIDRDTLTQIVDADAVERGRRYSTKFVLRKEVEALAEERRRQT